jgi:hypothetical protein
LVRQSRASLELDEVMPEFESVCVPRRLDQSVLNGVVVKVIAGANRLTVHEIDRVASNLPPTDVMAVTGISNRLRNPSHSVNVPRRTVQQSRASRSQSVNQTRRAS